MTSIEEYRFGCIRVNGQRYHNDIIILKDKIIPEWWRRQGHVLAAYDLSAIVAAAPDLLVVGTGSSGMLRVSPEAAALLEAHSIVLETYPTARAVHRFNELSLEGKDVAGGFHLSC